jgi:Myosin-like coiled-coil protein
MMNFMDTLKPENLTLEAIQKPFVELCEKQNALQLKLAILQRNIKKCSDETVKLEEEVQSTRDLSLTSNEKLRRISSLCTDLRKRLEISATPKAIEEERTKRIQLNDSFAIDVQRISKRIEEVASNKQINSAANEELRLQLTASIDNFHITESPAQAAVSLFDAEFLKSEEQIHQSTELSQMEYEDYLGHVGNSIATQVAIRELLASYNVRFQGFQDRLVENNQMFEKHRKRIDDVSEIVKTKHVLRTEAMLETIAVNKSLKAQSVLYRDSLKNIEKGKLKEENLLKLITVFEAEIAAKELELSLRNTSLQSITEK